MTSPIKEKVSRQGVFYKTFNSEEKLNSWIEKLHLSTNTYYSLQTGTKEYLNKKYKYYYCQHLARLQNAKSQTRRKTCRKNKRGFVPNFSCSSKIIVHHHQDIGKFSMRFFPVHNHECKEEYLKFQRFPRSLRRTIISKLSMGIDPGRILSDEKPIKINEETNPNDIQLSITDLLTAKYISRLSHKLKVATKYLDKDDAIAVKKFVLSKCQNSSKYNPIILYKAPGDKFVIGKNLLEAKRKHPNYDEIFCIGYQTKAQASIMLKFAGKILCVDATHGLTKYGYQLLSLMVKDDTGRGYPVGHLITSNLDATILTAFFKEIKERNPLLNVTTVMSDDDKATRSAFRAAFGENVKTLLCHWHVRRAWKNNYDRIDNDEAKSEIPKLLERTFHTKDTNEFNAIIEKIKSFKDCMRFWDYFDSTYMTRVEDWAKCHRNFFHDDVDTNMLLESFHNIIKTLYFKRKANMRVEVLIQMNLEITLNYWVRHIVATRLNLMADVDRISERHKRGMQILDSSVRKVSLLFLNILVVSRQFFSTR